MGLINAKLTMIMRTSGSDSAEELRTESRVGAHRGRLQTAACNLTERWEQMLTKAAGW